MIKSIFETDGIAEENCAAAVAAVVDATMPDRFRQVLHERAGRFAQRRTCAIAPSSRTPVLTFRWGSERFGVELSYVAHVFSKVPITTVPGSNGDLAGVANLHGTICSVFDVGRIVGLPQGSGASGYVVLLRAGQTAFGLCAETVEEVCDIELDKLVLLDELSSTGCGRLIKGTTDDRVSILNVEDMVTHIRKAVATALELVSS